MWKWWVYNLKHKELYSRYNQQSDPKPKRSIFSNRVFQCNIPKEEAIQNKDFNKIWKRKRYWTIITENWRVCSKCKQFKLRDEFARTKDWINWRTCNCKKCRNEMKADYRKRTQYSKDHEYKKKKRNLNIWDQIYFQDDVREVINYKMKKWYIVKSLFNGVLKQISTSDNHFKPNNHCVRFRKLENNITIETKPKQKEEMF